MGRFFGFLFFLVIVLGAAAGGAWFYGQHVYTQPGPENAGGAPRSVMIESGSNVPKIADKLKAAGAITDDFPFRMAVRVTDTGPRLKAGEYAIASGASLKDIVQQLVEGRVVLHAVTAPEGLTSAQIVRIVGEEKVLSGDLPEVAPAEGVLLPDTYMVQRGETRAAVLDRMVKAQQNLVAELWPTRQDGLPFKTQQEAIILASIVEKETGNASERPEVAAVFVNRLRRGMRLESDPTIIYGITKGEPLGRTIRSSELDRDDGYNTYKIDGLPPTPICNPGADAIRAVLNPPVSKALFFVGDGKGGHVFAETYSEHQKNVALYWKIRNANAAAGVNTPAVKPK
ncbi:MAG: endolytic transglycosylase MltG [Hyphomonadaceae bacterium]|nr:endolytic transglycosylase MltG [Hyphomonadaceae bacterium]